MKVIYVMENKINGKKYIGQTNNFSQRMRAHYSDALNPKSHSYSYPLSLAIRKYGWENFENKIVEEIPDQENYKFVDEREKFFIRHYNSLVQENGYNICTGGQGSPKKPRTYEELLNMSSLFKKEEIVSIQEELRQGKLVQEILSNHPRLTPSYLYNINGGLNFRNEAWSYPLHKYKEDISKMRSLEEIHKIKSDILDGISYKEISEKWNLSIGMISLINNGKQWKEDGYSYPLVIKSHSRLHNAATWVKDVQNDLMNSTLKLTEISQKYQKAYSTIKKINSGNSHRNKNYKYPLTSNRT